MLIASEYLDLKYFFRSRTEVSIKLYIHNCSNHPQIRWNYVKIKNFQTKGVLFWEWDICSFYFTLFTE